jgi:signal transduction histidine kinase
MAPGAGSEGFPKKTFLTIVGAITLALALSAGHTLLTLRELRTEYLENRAGELASSVARSVRGPERRTSLSLWNRVLEEALESGDRGIRFIALVDTSGRVLAYVGEGDQEFVSGGADLEELLLEEDFVFEYQFPSGRGGPRWQEETLSLGKLAVAIYSAQADFILRQAYTHAVISGIAILALWTLSLYFLRTARRFLDLKMLEESERHLTTLGRMSATLAHEIRNPLGAMKGLTQVAREQLPPDHATQDMLKTVVSEARRLENLVTDLLSFSRSRHLKLTDFNLVELVEEVTGLFEQEAAKAEVEISVSSAEPQLSIRSDRDGLEQVLLNVIGNALEASRQGGRVSVSVQRGGKGIVAITVKDRGPGVGSGDPEELFEPFKTTKVRGSGLGLAVSRQIISLFGGGIHLSNNSDGGACCTIEIPLRSVEH